ncbi:glycosyltransferase family 4 protein [Rhodobacteraceae bacterium R_SAG10]|nr:glycosyltransferase family 4 protein [Rhodobacteraceae bacterium R_SAG10]
MTSDFAHPMNSKNANLTDTGITVGLDATNLRSGGGVTHLVELLRFSDPRAQGIKKILVWGGTKTLSALAERPWLEKITPPKLDGNLLSRTWWQRFNLSDAARDAGCDVLFVPGGSYSGNFHPIVTMCRNLLPFEPTEMGRFGLSRDWLQLRLLRSVQSRSFKHADTVIFLSDFAKRTVLDLVGSLEGRIATIPHGVSDRFRLSPRPQKPISAYNLETPFHIVYVSIVNTYKHQTHCVEAVARLHREGFPIRLTLVGPAYPPALRRLEKVQLRVDPDNQFVNYQGPIPFDDLHRMYADCDLGLFASSCENMPNILLEKMAAGLPIACSNRGPMPEMLGDAGMYFDPESPQEIADTLRVLILDHDLRSGLAQKAFHRAGQFDWARCAPDTLELLAQTARGYR